jgi:hypothetical protein
MHVKIGKADYAVDNKEFTLSSAVSFFTLLKALHESP